MHRIAEELVAPKTEAFPHAIGELGPPKKFVWSFKKEGYAQSYPLRVLFHSTECHGLSDSVGETIF